MIQIVDGQQHGAIPSQAIAQGGMMATILTLLAMVFGFVGLFFLSEATMGVGILGLACLLGILARLSQADKQHKEVRAILEKGRDL